MTTTTPIANLESIERGDFVIKTNQYTKSLFKVVDKNHTPSGKVRLVLVNALTINPKTSTVIPENDRHWYPRRTTCFAKVNPLEFPDWVSHKRQAQTNGRFDRIGWQYDWSLFDQNIDTIEPRIRSPFNFESCVVDPIKSAINDIEKSIAIKLEHSDGASIRSVMQTDWFIDQIGCLKSLRSDLATAEKRLSILKKKSNADKN